MKLPPWDCYNDQDRKAFADFVMARLDVLDMVEANAPIPEGFLEYLDDEMERRELTQKARALGLEVQSAPRARGRPKRTVPPDATTMECAIRDVKRMRGIFRQYWGHANRLTHPMREEIAAAYWQLTDAEKRTLVRRFAKPKKKDRVE